MTPKIPGTVFHKPLLDLIVLIKKTKRGKLSVPAKAGRTVSGHCKPDGHNFKFEFSYPVLRKGRDLPFGKQLKNIPFAYKDFRFILEDFFLGTRTIGSFTATVARIYSEGFSKRRKYYYRLIIPLKRKMNFHYQIQFAVFASDMFKWSATGLAAEIGGETLYACSFYNKEKENFLSIESRVSQPWEDFADKAHAMKNAIGYLTGHLAGDQGFYFAYEEEAMKKPDHFYVTAFRESIQSMYTPVYSNPHGYVRNQRLAKKYYKAEILRPVSGAEFSTFCQKLYASSELQACVVLIMESSVASLLFMPGGFAIALETLSDLIIGDSKTKLAPIKDKSLSKKIRRECTEIINKYGSHIDAEDLKTLLNRIDQLNQQTNKARLRSPFDLLKIDLLVEDLAILQTRNDFLHGRTPDITGAGPGRNEDRINRDLYYASMRFYTLLSLLLLKWIGYDNYVVNHPKIQSVYCRIPLKELPYRKV